MSDTQFDLVVIGGGPGGYVAAIRAAQLGQKVALVEKEHLGGICLNWGCIPTKALLRSAEVYSNMKHAADFGLVAKDFGFDLAKVVERSRGVSKQLAGGVGHLLRKNKVKVFDGVAKLVGGGKVSVDGKDKATVTGKTIILATGARARVFPGLEPDGKLIWTYREALVPDVMPKRLLVIGSGAIGVEFASFFLTLGAEVTLVEVLPKVLPVEDDEISAFAHKSMKKQGMKIMTETMVKGLKKGKNTVTATLDSKGKMSELEVDRVIVAVGVTPNTENLGLDVAGVKLDDKGFIDTDQWLATSAKGIYAIGDVAGPPCLAHKASHEGVICVEKITGQAGVHPLDYDRIPGCTYGNPQVASVGLTEKVAKDRGLKVKIGRFPFMGNGKAIALGEPEGLVKTIFDEQTGELLGAHMVGAEVTELIQGYSIAKTLESTEEDLMHTIFPHPTLSEMMHESVLDAFDRVIHF